MPVHATRAGEGRQGGGKCPLPTTPAGLTVCPRAIASHEWCGQKETNMPRKKAAKFTCEKCGKAFSMAMHLGRHMTTIHAQARTRSAHAAKPKRTASSAQRARWLRSSTSFKLSGRNTQPPSSRSTRCSRSTAFSPRSPSVVAASQAGPERSGLPNAHPLVAMETRETRYLREDRPAVRHRVCDEQGQGRRHD